MNERNGKLDERAPPRYFFLFMFFMYDNRVNKIYDKFVGVDYCIIFVFYLQEREVSRTTQQQQHAHG